MNWLSKKYLTSKLRAYFHIDDENSIDIGVTVFGKQQLNCSNLTLKPEVVNKPSSLIHVRFCKISGLEVVVDREKMETEPISIKVDKVKLTVMFNPDKKEEPNNKKQVRPKLEEFYKAVGSEQEYRERNFIQEEIHQIKRMFSEFLLGKLSLKITNIDLSIEYMVNDKPHYLGLQIEEISLKERLVFKRVNSDEEAASEEIHCLFSNIDLYLAAKYEENVINRKAEHREVVRKIEKRKKKFIMLKQTINFYYSIEEKQMTILTNQLKLKLEDILLHEIMNLVNHVSSMISDRMKLRPGQGKLINLGKIGRGVGVYKQAMNISEGTLMWWQKLGKKIIEKFNKRENLNLFKNKKFRKYLFCLLYRYTFGAREQLQQFIDEYEFFKSDLQIMKYNQFIMQKIHSIQASKQTNIEYKGFIIFLNTIPRGDEKLKKMKIKPIDYVQVKKSNVIVNIENCERFIKIQQTELQDYLTISIKISRIELNIIKPSIFQEMKSDLTGLNPLEFWYKKDDVLDFYCEELIMKADPPDGKKPTYLTLSNNFKDSPDANTNINININKTKTKTNINSTMNDKESEKGKEKVKGKEKDKDPNAPYLKISIHSLQFEYNSQGNIYVNLPHFKVKDKETGNTIFLIRNLELTKENMHPDAYNWKITTEERMQLKTEMIYINADTLFIEKLLNLKNYLSSGKKLEHFYASEENQRHNFITLFLRKKIPNHRIFNSYSKTSIEVMLNQCLIVVPVYEKDRTIQVCLIGVNFSDPVNGKKSFGLEKLAIERSNYENIHLKISGNRKYNKATDNVVLVASSRPFSGYLSQNQNNSVDLTSILIPFLLIQVSCQDVYYLLKVVKIWQKILNNPYYLPPKMQPKSAPESSIKPAAIEFSKKMQKIVEKTRITEVKLEGIEFFFLSDYVNDGNNKIADVLIDMISYEFCEKFSSDTSVISVKDIFVRNCLGGRKVDRQALVNTLRTDCFFEEEPILINPTGEEIKGEGQLLICSDSPIPRNHESQSLPFLKISTQSVIDLEIQKSNNSVNIHLYPILIFYSPIFADAISHIMSIIRSLSDDTISAWIANDRNTLVATNPFLEKFGIQEWKDQEGFADEFGAEILVAEQFEILTKLTVVVDRVNLLIVNITDGKVVYSVSLGEIVVTHSTEPYVKKYYFKSNRFAIIDTSEEAGPYPIIIDACIKDRQLPLRGSFTSYNSQILRHRENKSAFFKLTINRPQIFFLKKKVMEFVNILNLLLRQTGIVQDQPPPTAQSQEKSQQKPQLPSLKYLVNIVSPEIKLLRGSLAKQGLNTLANSILISNYVPGKMKEESSERREESKSSLLGDLSEFSVMEEEEKFSLCNMVDDDIDMDFRSFQKEVIDGEVRVEKIFIKLNEMHIFGVNNWSKNPSEILIKGILDEPERPIMEIAEINMEFYNSRLDVNIPSIHSFLEEEDYRVLIRITEQNFGETPIMFAPPPLAVTQIKISFATHFEITEFIMRVNSIVKQGQVYSNKINELKITDLKGKNQIWTNGENETELGLENLTLTNDNGVEFIFNKDKESKVSQFLNSQTENFSPPSFFEEVFANGIRYTDFAEYEVIKDLESDNRKIEERIKKNQGNEYYELLMGNNSRSRYDNDANVEETNTEKICKWIKGMCQKCVGCCKCFRKDKEQGKMLIDVLKMMTAKQLEENERFESEEFISGEKNPLRSFIYHVENVLGFEYCLDEQKINKKKKGSSMVYMDFFIKPSGEKLMYMQAKKMNVLLENSKSLNDVIAFFNKPYANPEVPAYIRKPPFNNNKAFKMLIELNDSIAMMKNFKDNRKEKIIVVLDAIYDSESRGDNTFGPGRSNVKIQSLIKILFQNQFMKSPMALSDVLKASYHTNNIVPFGAQAKTRSSQRILLTSEGKQGVNFYIPIWIIKAISRIVKESFSSPSNEGKDAEEKEGQMEAMRSPKSALVSQRRESEYNEEIMMGPMKKKSSEDEVIESLPKPKEAHQLLEEEKQKKEKKAQNKPIKGSLVSKCMYLPEIQFHIEGKTNSCFLKTMLTNIKFSEFTVNEIESTFIFRNMKAGIAMNYWNLKLGLYEPCIEPWNFKMEQVINKRDDISSSSLKINSDFCAWDLEDERYINDLNVNISLALFQTYHELMIKYEQEDYDEDEICYDLTHNDDISSSTLFNESKRTQSEVRPKKMKAFPKELNAYFGRKFVTEDNYTIRKKAKFSSKDEFNPIGVRIFLFHSYFDHYRRKKRITFRTPYRIFNSTGLAFKLWFFAPRLKLEWTSVLKKSEYYAICQRIYTVDFLVHIDLDSKKEISHDASFISIKYLVQMHGRQSNFQRIAPNQKLWRSIFKFSNQSSEKWLDFRDVTIRIDSLSFTAVTFKSSDKNEVDILGGEHCKLYDTYTILLSPITIENFTYSDFFIIVNRRHKVVIPKNSKIEINQNLSEDIWKTTIEFEDDEMHQEYTFLNMQYGETSLTMETTKMQSVKLLVSRQTLTTCFVEIYAEWNLTNETNEEFRIWYSNRVFLFDKLSFSYLSNITGKNIDISLIGEEHHVKTIKQSNLIDDLVLSKRINEDKEPRLYQNMLEYEKKKCCNCCKSHVIYQHIEFVFLLTDDPIYPLSKKVEIKYKYQIRNYTNRKLRLFQYSENFEIANLSSYKSESYIFYYDFIPKRFFLQMIEPQSYRPEGMRGNEDEQTQEVKLKTCMFEIEKFPGTSFAFKIKKSSAGDVLDYYKKFHYLRVEIIKNEEETSIDIYNANMSNFPIFMDNLTDYSIKITENDDEFVLRPHERIPFAWSNLIDDSEDGNKLEVRIDDAQPKTFYFNTKSTFDPIKIMGQSQQKKKHQENLYLKESCLVNYEYDNISGVCVLILDLFDNRLRIHNDKEDINIELNVQEVLKMDILAAKIELYFSEDKRVRITPSSKTFKNWVESLHSCINENVIDSVFFTIEVYRNSRVFFFRTIMEEDYQLNKQEYTIAHLNISLISSLPEQILTIYLFNASYSQQDKKNRVNYKKYESNETEKVITIKKLKINNQKKEAISPVVVSQIKKSSHPFLELRISQQKLHMIDKSPDQVMLGTKILADEPDQDQILHYKEIVFFIDEAEQMVEYALFVELMSLKNSFNYVSNQYAVGAENELNLDEIHESSDGVRDTELMVSTQRRERLVEIKQKPKKRQINPRVYINYLEIKPLKMTISVSLEHNKDEKIKLNLIGILRYVPFGIENAIIEIPSYQFTHVFYDQQELNKQLTKYYQREITNKILANAGSYDLLMPVKLVTGLGTGVKNIFYDPFYELVKKKEIKAVGKTFCEGLISLIIFLFVFLIKLISLVFKIIALLSFDQEFKTKRESFRKQIFKSPVDGFLLGGKNWWNVFKSFFLSFTRIGEEYKGYYCFGYLFGFFVCLLKIIFWIPKVIVSTYDFIYVIGMGLINWGYYEENAMKVKSRPRRTFEQKQLIKYNYLYAYGQEIIEKDQLNQIQNEEISFVKPVQFNDENSYLILSNYRIIYNNSTLSSSQEIKLYQIASVTSTESLDKKLWSINIKLSIPNNNKIFFFCSYSVDQYVLHFNLKLNLVKFLRRLRKICQVQRLDMEFIEGEELKKEVEQKNDMILDEILNMGNEEVSINEKVNTRKVGEEEDMVRAKK